MPLARPHQEESGFLAEALRSRDVHHFWSQPPVSRPPQTHWRRADALEEQPNSRGKHCVRKQYATGRELQMSVDRTKDVPTLPHEKGKFRPFTLRPIARKIAFHVNLSG